MADLRKIGLKWGNDISENLAPKFHSKVKATSPTPLPPSPRKVRFWHTFFFALLPMNGPSPAEQKFMENTEII